MSGPHDLLRELSGARTVLVVDDEPGVRQLIAVVLEMEGYRVLQAADGRAALALAASTALDLITLDVMMPGLDGWEVADQLDADPATAAVPRVMVSGKPLAELRSAAGHGRAAAVLTKPFDLVEFLRIVDRVVSERPPAAAAHPSPTAAEELAALPGAARALPPYAVPPQRRGADAAPSPQR